MTALLLTAFAAGLVATVNPCGFAMLPAYLGYFIGGATDGGRAAGVRRALIVSGVMSLGFLVVFGLAGLLISLGVQAIIEFIPWLAVLVGVGLLVLGIRTYRGAYLTMSLGSGRVDRSSVFRFGISYAIASLSCTLPIFLSLVAGAFARASVYEGLLAFVVYAIGMSLVVTAITVGVALGHDRLVRLTRSSAQYVNRISGAVLVVAGIFIVWYWAVVLSSGSAALGSNPLVRWVDRLSSRVTSFVAERPLVVAFALAALVLAAVIRLRSDAASTDEGRPETSRRSSEVG